jgi:hypothetical protein
MWRALYISTPAAVFLATVVILTTPFLGFIALMVAVLAALAALVATASAAPYLLGRAIHRRWRERSGATNQQRAVLPPAQRHNT